MTSNLKQYPNSEYEIDLRGLIKMLMKSKKLVILTILIFIIASIIYSLTLESKFKSSSILEIGYYEIPDGTIKLIESPSDIISSIRTNLIYKKRNKFLLDNLIITSPEDRLIELEITSKSSKENENILTEINNHIFDRHFKIDKLKTELSDQYQSQIFDIISKFEKKDLAIEQLKLFSHISSYTDEVFHLNQILKSLNNVYWIRIIFLLMRQQNTLANVGL